MTQASNQEKVVSRQRLMQMLHRRRSEPQAGPQPGSDAPLFDWTSPHHFAPQEWQTMKNLGKKVAAYIEKAMAPVCLVSPKVTMKKIVQQFAYSMAEQTLRQENVQYFLPMQAAAKVPDGFVNIQSEAVSVLIGQLLRDSEARVGSNGQYSTLEESILQDGLFIIADAIIASLHEYGELMVKRSDQLIKTDWPLDAHQMQDMCGFSFLLDFSGHPIELTVLFLAEAIEPALGVPPRSQKALNQAELSKLIVRQLYDAPVDVTARLCVSSIRMEDLMRLEQGDVVILDKKISEPAEVLLNSRLTFQAWPANCENKLALVIAQSAPK